MIMNRLTQTKNEINFANNVAIKHFQQSEVRNNSIISFVCSCWSRVKNTWNYEYLEINFHLLRPTVYDDKV